MVTPVVVVIEDEPQIRRFVRSALEAEGWQVFEADTVQKGLTEACTRKPDLLVLDLGLPDSDGLDLIRDVRGWSGVPIIVLSARSGEGDKIAALDAGADDYLTKPFGVGELLARVRANLRRPRAAIPGGGPVEEADPVFRFGQVEVDRQARLVRRYGAAAVVMAFERSSRSASSFSSFSSRSRDAGSVSFFSASRSIFNWITRRSSSSSASGFESTCMRSRLDASSIRSIALSGRNRSVM